MTKTAWLNNNEQDAWRAIVSVIMRLPSALDTQLQRESGLTHFDFSVLVQLSEAPERTLQLSELGKRANSSLSRLSHVVTKLERQGWVERKPIAGSRGFNATLTDSGFLKLSEAAPGHVEAVRALLFDGLTASQVQQLTKVATAISKQIDLGLAAGIGRA
ncbi:MAG: MarR family winged helix-turn-helix transcriptional regulator [Mycobacteriaceae bacterium]